MCLLLVLFLWRTHAVLSGPVQQESREQGLEESCTEPEWPGLSLPTMFSH